MEEGRWRKNQIAQNSRGEQSPVRFARAKKSVRIAPATGAAETNCCSQIGETCESTVLMRRLADSIEARTAVSGFELSCRAFSCGHGSLPEFSCRKETRRTGDGAEAAKENLVAGRPRLRVRLNLFALGPARPRFQTAGSGTADASRHRHIDSIGAFPCLHHARQMNSSQSIKLLSFGETVKLITDFSQGKYLPQKPLPQVAMSALVADQVRHMCVCPLQS